LKQPPPPKDTRKEKKKSHNIKTQLQGNLWLAGLVFKVNGKEIKQGNHTNQLDMQQKIYS